MVFGWHGDMIVDGQPVNWSAYPHYDNAYTHTAWGSETMTLSHGGQSLPLDLKG